ncbi:MAG TPA: hypothetical protein VMB72_06430, partial [Acidimicrobiales bacterium]|nr:hypothetical protein [Acidimicrobiales bacterium]
FPFRALQGHIAASWAEPARCLFRNWLHGVRALVSAPAGAGVGPAPVRLPARLGAAGAEP